MVIRREGSMNEEKLLWEFDKDKSEVVADVIIRGVRCFCTRLHGEFNKCLFDHICRVVRGHASDGASYCSKVAAILRGSYFPKMI